MAAEMSSDDFGKPQALRCIADGTRTVLLDETIAVSRLAPGMTVVDGTLGGDVRRRYSEITPAGG